MKSAGVGVEAPSWSTDDDREDEDEGDREEDADGIKLGCFMCDRDFLGIADSGRP